MCIYGRWKCGIGVKVGFTREITMSEACKRRFLGVVICDTLEPLPSIPYPLSTQKGGGARFIRKSEKAIKKGTSKEKKESSE